MKTYALGSFLLFLAKPFWYDTAWREQPKAKLQPGAPDQEPPPAVRQKSEESGEEREAPRPQQELAEPEASPATVADASVPAASEPEEGEHQATEVFDRALYGLWLLLDVIGAIFFLRQVRQRYRSSSKPGMRDCAVQTDEAPRNMEMENLLRECAANEKDCEAKRGSIANTCRLTQELQEELNRMLRDLNDLREKEAPLKKRHSENLAANETLRQRLTQLWDEGRQKQAQLKESEEQVRQAETQRVTECREVQELISELEACRSEVQTLGNQDTELKDASAEFSSCNVELKAYRDRNRELREELIAAESAATERQQVLLSQEIPATRVSTGSEESAAASVASRARVFGRLASAGATGSPKARLKSRQDQGSLPTSPSSPPVLQQTPQQQQQQPSREQPLDPQSHHQMAAKMLARRRILEEKDGAAQRGPGGKAVASADAGAGTSTAGSGRVELDDDEARPGSLSASESNSPASLVPSATGPLAEPSQQALLPGSLPESEANSPASLVPPMPATTPQACLAAMPRLNLRVFAAAAAAEAEGLASEPTA